MAGLAVWLHEGVALLLAGARYKGMIDPASAIDKSVNENILRSA